MNRSSWKLPYFNDAFGRLFSKIGDKPILVWSRGSTFLLPHLGKNLKIHNGKKFISINVKRSLLGHYCGDFCMSKLLGKKIHLRKRKKKSIFKK